MLLIILLLINLLPLKIAQKHPQIPQGATQERGTAVPVSETIPGRAVLPSHHTILQGVTLDCTGHAQRTAGLPSHLIILQGATQERWRTGIDNSKVKHSEIIHTSTSRRRIDNFKVKHSEIIYTSTKTKFTQSIRI